MCGIAGILRAGGAPVDPAELRAMARALSHRGPDDQGFHAEPGLGLASRRLAILDPSPAGHQPMANEDGTVWLVYNGQLYDFEPLRRRLEQRGHRFRSRTDTEILVHLYEEEGEGLLQSIDGMFAFALWDARRRRLLLARDRLGIKPLVYARRDTDVVFGSELGALFALGGMPRDVSPSAVVHYLYQSSVPGGTSIVEGVARLPPAHYAVVEEGTVRTARYWEGPPAEDERPAGFAAAAHAFRSRLDAAVRSHLVADVPVGTFLSGGLDSTAVTRAARDASASPLHTFSVRFDGRTEDESPHARRVSAQLGTEHHELHLGPGHASSLPEVMARFDEPFAVSSAFALYHLAGLAREHVKVVLTGDGADETLGGYPWRHEPETSPRTLLRRLGMTVARSARGARLGAPGLRGELAGRLRRMRSPGERYAEIVTAFVPEEMEALLHPELAEVAARAWAENPVRLAYETEPGGDEVNRRLRADLRTTLVDEMLAKVDRMTMARGLEARVPFLDRALVESAFRLPGGYKVRWGRGKRLLRRALADLPAVARRRKHGFDVPLGEWLRGPLRPWMGDLLSAGTLRRRGFFRPEVVESLVSAHLRGRGDYSRKIFTLVALEAWLQRLPTAFTAQAPAASRAAPLA
ncbi:MAG: asparagine synthase (glutamine-hydrolyzing) [Acidobacteria bacterium]|nr:MAG: asparagine synthase (glutamine-hydrolyzing) [Acidobacteriota bacterium]